MITQMYKYQEEQKNYIFDFTNVLANGETISTYAFKFQPLETVEPSLTMTNGTPTINLGQVTISIKGGSRTGSYLVICSVTTTAARILTDSAVLNIM